MPSLNFTERLTEHLPARSMEALATRVGFQQRQPLKIAPAVLLKALCVLALCSRSSFETLASVVGLLGGRSVSKQALAKRFSAPCVEFVRHALYSSIGALVKFERVAKAGVFKPFRRVLIQDSTSLALHPRLAAAFPGSRNQTAKEHAIVKIQAIYDLLSERLVSFSLSPFTRNDQAASPDMLAVAQAGDLVLRDLGYFVLSVFKQLRQRGVFFLSRLRYDVRLLSHDGQRFELLKQLHKVGRVDMTLLLGAKEQVPVRLLAVPLPQAQAAARRRKARQNRDRRCRPGREHLELLGWEIFITNVDEQICSSETLCQIYGLRWRIEIVFKAWKSHWRIAELPKGSATQVQVMLYAQLLFISIFQSFFGPMADYFEKAYGRALSLLRITHFFVENHWLIACLTHNAEGADLLEELIARHCCYAKRKDRLNYQEALRCLG